LLLLLRELLPLVLHQSFNDSVVLALVPRLGQLPGRLPLEVLDEGRDRLLLNQISDVEVRVPLGYRCVVKQAVSIPICLVNFRLAFLAENLHSIKLPIKDCYM
jgi:hypothetical protein